MDRETLKTNLQAVRRRITEAARRAGRDPGDVTLIAVTKSVDAETTQAVLELGVRDIAENRQQTAAEKLPHVPALAGAKRPTLHFIGPLQRNKVRRVLEQFDVIHSVDSVKLAQEISKRAEELQRTAGILVQVNVAGEAQKGGLEPGELRDSLKEILRLPRLHLWGLMCMAPYDDDPETARPHFKRLAELSREMIETSCMPAGANSLSMGMSGDFEVAIEEGATHVRVGSALYSGLESV
ncbi:MAG: YggS family pyridoxal phosphate-dependent enzyme [Planctomycetes bacterium]|nr:YggS family pyridoxal phosphate-dependent enzyme [Planctomycetota bacterium]